MNLFWRPGLLWTQLLAGSLFLHTAEIVLMSEKLAWGHGKWKQIFHLDGRRARDGQDGRKQKAGRVHGAPFVLLPTHAMYHHCLAPGVFILHLPFPEAVLGPWDPAKNKVDRHTVSVDVLMERQWAGTHSFAEGSVRVRWQKMANGRSSRKAFGLPFDRGTDTHVRVCLLCRPSLWKETSVAIIYAVEISWEAVQDIMDKIAFKELSLCCALLIR